MKVALLRVGIDSGSGGSQAPLFQDGSFEYIPIPDGFGVDERTYGNTLGRHGRFLADYFPPSLRARLRDASMHVDPEFATFTYGDPTPPKAGLRHLQAGDLLAFYCGLEGWGFSSTPRLYVLGYFEVLTAGKATEFTEDEIETHFGANFHVRHKHIFERQKADLVLVKGTPASRLLKRAVCISEMSKDRSGKPLKVLSKAMQKKFGDFGGHISIQRSPTRWVAAPFTTKAADFIRSLE